MSKGFTRLQSQNIFCWALTNTEIDSKYRRDCQCSGSSDYHNVDIEIQHGENDTRWKMEIPLSSSSSWSSKKLNVSSLGTRRSQMCVFNYRRCVNNVKVKQRSLLTIALFFQNEWTEAVDTGGRDGTPGDHSDGRRRRQSRETRWILQNSDSSTVEKSIEIIYICVFL